jgi:hypothetical protein
MVVRYNFLVSFLLAISPVGPSTSSAHASTSLRATDIVLDVVKIGLTNAAMTKHTEDSVTAATLHAAAAAVGIARNLVLIKLLHNTNRATANGDYLAIGSSITTNLLDLITHIKNVKKAAPYLDIKTASMFAIRSAQTLELLTNYLANYSTLDLCRNQEFKTALRNAHTSLEAAEKMLMLQHCESSLIDRQILMGILASNSLLNTASGCYYTIQATKTHAPEQNDTDNQEVLAPGQVDILGKANVPEDFICPVCRDTHNNLAPDVQVIHLACNHDMCLECCRGDYQRNATAELVNPNPLDPEGPALREPHPVRTRLFRNGNYSCSECRQISHVRPALNANPTQ